MGMIKNPTQIKDLMYHFAPNSGATEAHCHGIIVGTVGALMATGMTWRQAIIAVAQAMPDTARLTEQSVPDSWLDTLKGDIARVQAVRLKGEIDKERAIRDGNCCDGETFHASNCPVVRP